MEAPGSAHGRHDHRVGRHGVVVGHLVLRGGGEQQAVAGGCPLDVGPAPVEAGGPVPRCGAPERVVEGVEVGAGGCIGVAR